MFSTNPTRIQECPVLPAAARRPAPLVLIHDGGGTTFSYHCLGPLGRSLYGIHSPYFNAPLSALNSNASQSPDVAPDKSPDGDNSDDRPWPGGLPQMARHYASLLPGTVPAGEVILGGWSLGGLAALEMARALADNAEPRFRVLGLMLIDSVNPPRLGEGDAALVPVVPFAVPFTRFTREETKRRVRMNFEMASRLVSEWELPTWEGRPADQGGGDPACRPPPAILLRAREYVPVEPGLNAVSRVDIRRGDRLLGWGRYREDFIIKVEDIPGHHFNIFAEEHLDTLTRKLKAACCDIEALARKDSA